MPVPFVLDNQQHRMAGPTDDETWCLENRLEGLLGRFSGVKRRNPVVRSRAFG
jgi:hypothetical protein